MTTVLIRGESVAACCCARLLESGGVPFRHERISRSKLPAIMLGESAQKLFSDIFPQANLFQGLPQIRRRIVQWGAGAKPMTLAHSAVVISEQTLLDRMQPWLGAAHEAEDVAADWTIFATRPLPENAEDLAFGSRRAAALAVTLERSCDKEASYVESLPEGWLFLLPASDGGWLLAVGASAEALLAQSTLIAPQIASLGGERAAFPCHPRIAMPFCGNGWLACGSAALGFDPLCGDGSGYAAREAILACAVIRAAQGDNAHDLISHYRDRVLAGFARHLEVCAGFYRTGHAGPWWQEQTAATERGLLWRRSQLAQPLAFKYRLDGFSLAAVSA